MLYSNLLTEEARCPWTKIVEEQIGCIPWTDLYGVDHPKKHTVLWEAFIECITFQLQTMICYDAAEVQRFYISNGLKNPYKVSIRDFVQRIQHLNGYLDLL
jgi:hypothetical protein